MLSTYLQFLLWYFVDMPLVLLKILKNFLLFNLNYFSVPTLLKTYFSHWHKYYSPYKKAFEIWANIEILVFNMMSRVIGAFLRTFLIIMGIFLEVLILSAGVAVLVGWFLLPLFLILGILFGFNLVFGLNLL